MRPWCVWWKFFREGDHITDIIIRTDHPKYKHLDYIRKFPIQECEDELGYIDTWLETWFEPFESDIKSGRISIHKLLKDFKNE